jgi:hypothetical protein
MEQQQNLPREKADFKNLEGYLKNNNLLDERGIWFAGYDDQTRGAQNAIAANVFYGNKRLMIITVCNENIFLLKNRKKEFAVSKVGTLSDKYSLIVHHNILFPSIELVSTEGETIMMQAKRNKQKVKEFKKLLNKNK